MRRQFQREFKVSVLQELETASLTEVCRKHSGTNQFGFLILNLLIYREFK